MAETYILLKEIPSRKMRKMVRNFLDAKDVSLIDSSGLHYSVRIKRGKMILSQEDDNISKVSEYTHLVTV